MKVKLIFILGFIFFQLNCSKWIGGKKNTITTFIYAPALFSTELQMSKYCPSFIASSGEYVSCSSGIEVIKEPVSACNFSELNLDSSACSILNYINPINWVSASAKQILSIISVCQCLQSGLDVKPGFKPYLDINFTLLQRWINFSKLNFGQDTDIKVLSNVYERHIVNVNNEYPKFKHDVVLYGVARGAATIFNFIAENNACNVKAIICESVFDSVPSLLEYRFPFLKNVILKIIETFTMFKKENVSPIANIKKIPNIPILLITSLKDEIVPFQCSFNLYKSLKNSGFKNVYLLILKNSSHLKYTDCEDKKLYEQTVHAFYKKFNLPYIKELAEEQKNIDCSIPNF